MSAAAAPRRTLLPWWAYVIALVAIGLGCAFAFGPPHFQDPEYWKVFLFGRLMVLMYGLVILAAIMHARGGGSLYIRRIPGLTAIDETVGRATEMGRPITYSMGLGGMDIITLQSLAIALHVVRLSIRFGTRVIITMRHPTIYAVADEAVAETYAAAGRPESFNRDDVRFLSDRQFAYASAMTGLIIREKAASNYMFGQFFAESLILAEAGNQIGAIQVAGTPTITQVPFFIAACDYTIIGDEYYAATAYLTREPVLTGSVVGQDRGKMIFLSVIVLGILAMTVFSLMQAPPEWGQALVDLFRKAK